MLISPESSATVKNELDFLDAFHYDLITLQESELKRAKSDTTKSFATFYYQSVLEAYLNIIAIIRPSANNTEQLLALINDESVNNAKLRAELARIDSLRFAPRIFHPVYDQKLKTVSFESDKRCYDLVRLIIAHLEKLEAQPADKNLLALFLQLFPKQTFEMLFAFKVRAYFYEFNLKSVKHHKVLLSAKTKLHELTSLCKLPNVSRKDIIKLLDSCSKITVETIDSGKSLHMLEFQLDEPRGIDGNNDSYVDSLRKFYKDEAIFLIVNDRHKNHPFTAQSDYGDIVDQIEIIVQQHQNPGDQEIKAILDQLDQSIRKFRFKQFRQKMLREDVQNFGQESGNRKPLTDLIENYDLLSLIAKEMAPSDASAHFITLFAEISMLQAKIKAKGADAASPKQFLDPIALHIGQLATPTMFSYFDKISKHEEFGKVEETVDYAILSIRLHEPQIVAACLFKYTNINILSYSRLYQTTPLQEFIRQLGKNVYNDFWLLLIKSMLGPNINLMFNSAPILFLATSTNNLVLLNALFENPFLNPNLQDGKGNTALHDAALRGYSDCYDRLLQDKRTNKYLPNYAGKLAEELIPKNLTDLDIFAEEIKALQKTEVERAKTDTDVSIATQYYYNALKAYLEIVELFRNSYNNPEKLLALLRDSKELRTEIARIDNLRFVPRLFHSQDDEIIVVDERCYRLACLVQSHLKKLLNDNRPTSIATMLQKHFSAEIARILFSLESRILLFKFHRNHQEVYDFINNSLLALQAVQPPFSEDISADAIDTALEIGQSLLKSDFPHQVTQFFSEEPKDSKSTGTGFVRKLRLHNLIEGGLNNILLYGKFKDSDIADKVNAVTNLAKEIAEAEHNKSEKSDYIWLTSTNGLNTLVKKINTFFKDGYAQYNPDGWTSRFAYDDSKAIYRLCKEFYDQFAPMYPFIINCESVVGDAIEQVLVPLADELHAMLEDLQTQIEKYSGYAAFKEHIFITDILRRWPDFRLLAADNAPSDNNNSNM
ncbi:MAG: ankyrin repeat domain-containing protein [Pseudomonadota bacterium]|nr:ankyrin repeat domain-containing protein [Pseudomonadota bacterium]